MSNGFPFNVGKPVTFTKTRVPYRYVSRAGFRMIAARAGWRPEEIERFLDCTTELPAMLIEGFAVKVVDDREEYEWV